MSFSRQTSPSTATSRLTSTKRQWTRQKENTGKSMTIHIIPKLVSYAFPKAMTSEDAMAGFKDTGVYPIGRNVLPDHKFLAGYTTDRPLQLHKPTTAETAPSTSATKDLSVLWTFVHLVDWRQERKGYLQERRVNHRFIQTHLSKPQRSLPLKSRNRAQQPERSSLSDQQGNFVMALCDDSNFSRCRGHKHT